MPLLTGHLPDDPRSMQEQWLAVQAVEGFDAFAVVQTPSEADAFVKHLAAKDKTLTTNTTTTAPTSGAALCTSRTLAGSCGFYQDAEDSSSWSAEHQKQIREKIRLRLGLQLPPTPAIMKQHKRRCL